MYYVFKSRTCRISFVAKEKRASSPLSRNDNHVVSKEIRCTVLLMTRTLSSRERVRGRGLVHARSRHTRTRSRVSTLRADDSSLNVHPFLSLTTYFLILYFYFPSVLLLSFLFFSQHFPSRFLHHCPFGLFFRILFAFKVPFLSGRISDPSTSYSTLLGDECQPFTLLSFGTTTSSSTRDVRCKENTEIVLFFFSLFYPFSISPEPCPVIFP